MKVLHSALLATLGAACTAGHRPAVPTLRPPASVIDSARRAVRAIVDRDKLPGMAVTVSVGRVGQPVVWHEGFGYADVSTGTPATPSTAFRIGSVSKLLTAMTLARMAQSGLVDLDRPIGASMNSLPPRLEALTLRQLAGHVAGVRHYRANEFLTTAHYDHLRDAIAVFAQDSLVAPPGTRYAYSSYGYNLIGAVLEAVAAKPFTELVQRYVLDPLGMDATVPDVRGKTIARRAQPYTVATAGAVPAPDDDLSGRWPSGGYLASTDDLARLGRAVLADGLLNQHWLETMLTPQRLASGAATSVGLGWRVSQDSAGRRYFHHGGSSNGGAAFLLVYPDQQLVIALASNAFTQWGERDALRIASIFLGDGSRVPQVLPDDR